MTFGKEPDALRIAWNRLQRRYSGRTTEECDYPVVRPLRFTGSENAGTCAGEVSQFCGHAILAVMTTTTPFPSQTARFVSRRRTMASQAR